MKKKTAALALAVVLVLSAAAGGTMAYLIDTTDNVKNIFVSGKVNAWLDEAKVDSNGKKIEDADPVTKNTYPVIPGCTADKNPTVHIEKGSLPCYVFVCVEDPLNAAVSGAVAYTVGDNWESITTSGTKTVYQYKEKVDAQNEQQDLIVFDGVSYDYTKVTEENIDNLDDTIEVSAYVVQAVGVTESEVKTAALAYFEIS